MWPRPSRCPRPWPRRGLAGIRSTTGQYISLWFGLLTASLPLHRALWEIAPFALSLVATSALGWSVLKLARWRAALLAVVLTIVVSPQATLIFTNAFSHNIAYLDTCLLGAYVVWLARTRPRGRVATLAAPLLAGVLLGVGLASDLLLLVCGIVPFVFTAVVGGIQRGRRAKSFAVSALVTVAVAIAVALITSHAMRSLGYVVPGALTSTSPLSALAQHSRYLFQGLKLLFGGYLASQPAPGPARAALGVACDVTMAVALIALLVAGAYTVARLIGSVGRRFEASDVELARRLHIVYWAGSAASTVVAFEFSVMAFEAHPEYYATLIFSVAAVLPLLMRRSAVGRWLVPLGAAVFFAASLVGLTSADLDPAPIAREEPAIAALADANGATIGYAGYWYASSLTWNSDERVRVRPVLLCTTLTGVGFCPFPLGRVPSWYVPSKRRSFLLVNPGEKFVPWIPVGLGKPLASYRVGDETHMLIYPYDIASRLAPASD
jgi:hypothetical protein